MNWKVGDRAIVACPGSRLDGEIVTIIETSPTMIPMPAFGPTTACRDSASGCAMAVPCEMTNNKSSFVVGNLYWVIESSFELNVVGQLTRLDEA